MAARTLHNPRTGETIEFLIVSEDSDGKVFSMGYAMAPGAAIADEHNHPFQQMSIAVHEGVLTCTVGGHDRLVGSGQSITIPAGVHHFQRNDTDETVRAVEEYRPAMHMQEFFEVLIGWANDGKTNEFGMPGPLRAAVMHRHFADSIRSSSWRRNVVSRVLAPLGVVMGYGREIEHYVRASAESPRQGAHGPD